MEKDNFNLDSLPEFEYLQLTWWSLSLSMVLVYNWTIGTMAVAQQTSM